MRKWTTYHLFCVLIFSLILLTGCKTSGIHLFYVTFIGEVKENSLLHQPIKGVQIFTEDGKLLGETNESGIFSVKAAVNKGVVNLTFRHPDYNSSTIRQLIDGSSEKTIQLPPRYLLPAGGKISGRITREIIPEVAFSKSLTNHPNVRLETEADKITGEYNLALKQNKTWLLDKLNGRGKIIYESDNGFYTIKIYHPEDEELISKELALDGQLEYMVPNRVVKPLSFIPEDELLGALWNLRMIDTISAWQYSTGKGVIVAVLDSLYTTVHPDLAANLLPALDANDDLNDDNNEQLWMSLHGLHVAGIIGAAANQMGIVGVAPEAKILPIRVFEGRGGITSSVQAIVRGIDLAIQNGAKIINLSLGMSSYDEALHAAVKKAYAAGILLIAAAGNSGGEGVYYPAAFPEVIAVGSVGPDGTRAYYSSYGNGIELMAPGGVSNDWSGILSTGVDFNNNFSWIHLSGTSMAAPHVSGVAALLMANGITDPDYIRLILRETARDMDIPGYDLTTGYGLIDAFKVLNRFQHSYVFFGSVVSGYAQIKSPVIQVEMDGTFELGAVRPGIGKVIGWIDVNENYKIDSGDYLGETTTFEVSEGVAPIDVGDVIIKLVPGEFHAIDITKQMP